MDFCCSVINSEIERYIVDLDSNIGIGSEIFCERPFEELISDLGVLFDPLFYRDRYPDIGSNDLDAFRHYATVGWREHRQPHPLFDVDYWERSLSELGIEILDQLPLHTYLRRKDTWNAATHPLIDPEYYEGQLIGRGMPRHPVRPPLVDLLTRGEMIPCNYLFDPEFYCLQARIYGVVVSETPILHYVRNRGLAGLDPHPLFNCRFYVEAHPDVVAAGNEPLQHFMQTGAREGLDPNPLFSLQYYYSSSKLQSKKVDILLKHYIEHGGRELRNPHPLFDARLYATYYPDSVRSGDNPLSHYVRTWVERGIRFPPWGTLITPLRPRRGERTPIDAILLSHEFTRTGAPLILLKIAENLANRFNLRTIVLTLEGGPLAEDFAECSSVVNLSNVPGGVSARESFVSLVGRAIAGSGGPKFILANTACVASIVKELAASGVPLITLIHEMASSFSYVDFKAVYDSSRLVIYPAEFVRAEAHNEFPLPIDKTAVLPQGLLNPRFGRKTDPAMRAALRKQIGAPSDAFIVLGCGTVDFRKGVDIFVKLAFAAIKRKLDEPATERPLHFVWMGESVAHTHSLYWYLQQDLVRGKIDAHVHFVGAKADPEPYFGASDAFVVTSRLDPFPCVIHEAMACGIPIIIFADAGGGAEALRGNAGIVVPYGDINAMAQAIWDIVENPQRAEDYGERAKKLVRTKYVFSNYVDRILDQIGEITGAAMTDRKKVSKSNPATRRVILTIPDWRPSSVTRFIGGLASALIARGFDAELIFTSAEPELFEPDHVPKTPYRFLLPGFRKLASYKERWDCIERVLMAAAPAIYVHNTDPVGSAVAPIVPKGIGILGILHDESPEYYEQASRLARYWQRAVAVSPRTFDRLKELFPALSKRTVQIPYGVPDLPPPLAPAPDSPLQIIGLNVPPNDQESWRFLRIVVDGLRNVRAEFSLTLIVDARTDDLPQSLFERETDDGVVRFVSAAASSNVPSLLREADICLAFDREPMPVSPDEVMSYGLPIILVTAGDPTSAFDNLVDGQNGYVVERRQRAKCVNRLTEVTRDHALRTSLRNAAYETSRTRCVRSEGVYDRYAELINRMLKEINGGRYRTTEPLFRHPVLGGLSMPPVLQFAPDQVEDAFREARKASPSAAAKVHLPPLKSVFRPIFNLSPTGTQPQASPMTQLRWVDGEFEILASNKDPGFVITLPDPVDNLLVLRMTLFAELAGTAQFYSRTVKEDKMTANGEVIYAFKSGLTSINVKINRDAAIQQVRVDPGDQPGTYSISGLSILGPARPVSGTDRNATA
jgi:glycosyltransferase involved in cell wall biosynthesis